MTKMKLNWLLRDWVFEITQQIEESAYPSSDTTTRIGTGSRMFGGILVKDSWSRPELAELNNAINTLPTTLSNIIVSHRVLKYTYRRMAEEFGFSKSMAPHRIKDAEDALLNLL